MTSVRAAARPRLAGGVLLASRRACALLAGRHPNLVRRHCEPVACDVGSRGLLYDADACVKRLRSIRRVSLDKESTSGHPQTQ